MKLFEPRGSSAPPRDRHYPGRAPIEAYGNGGFRFAEMSHRGSILCLPTGIHGWTAASPAEITEETLELALAQAGTYEVMLLGSGASLAPVPERLKAAFRERGSRVDVMSTGSAIRIYNIMLGENRSVAAALLAVE